MKTARRGEAFRAYPSLLRRGLLAAGSREMTATGEHAAAPGRLLTLHKVPLDRALIAQAEEEGATLPTMVATMVRYAGPVQLVGRPDLAVARPRAQRGGMRSTWPG